MCEGESFVMMGDRWRIEGGSELVWDVEVGEAHEDHMEMSGERVSAIVRYGVSEEGELSLSRHVVWPSLRTIPNDTHGSLSFVFTGPGPGLATGEKDVVQQFRLRGIIYVESICGSLKTSRWLFPSIDKPIYFELAIIENTGNVSLPIKTLVPSEGTVTPALKGLDGSYVIDALPIATNKVDLPPGDHALHAIAYRARRSNEMEEYLDSDELMAELDRRRALVSNSLEGSMQFDCPVDDVLPVLFRFSQLRATESVFRTRNGLMHSPGGGAYYAAVWANDQAEYAAPMFALLEGSNAYEATVNMFRMYKKFMNNTDQHLPSSIIAEGTDHFSANGDRGDGSMVAYALGRFLLLSGDEKLAEELLPLLEWCLEFCNRHLNPQGVVTSNSDELEGRFPTGTANLYTSALTYDALVSAKMLCDELGKASSSIYQKRSEILKKNIESYFGAQVEGFDTYRYFDGCTVLRSWICIPLTMGIFERASGTIDALFSKQLWTADGLRTTSGNPTFWDRATLKCLRGVYASGEVERAHKHFLAYSRRRLLGNHVPYPVEAYPEGNERHLSAESALYCRVVIEGLFGLRPTGFRKLTCTPRLPPTGTVCLCEVYTRARRLST